MFLSFLLLAGSSCKLLQKVSDEDRDQEKEADEIEIVGPKQLDPETGELTEVIVLGLSMDTIKWKIRSKKTFPPITSDTPLEPTAIAGAEGISGEGSAAMPRISLFLPFLTNRFDPLASEVPESSLWALHFYSGVQLALDKLDEESAKLQIHVYDTQFSPDKTRDLLVNDKKIRDSRLLIGPYRSVNAQLLANFAKQFSIPCVSPHSANDQVTSNNPFYIQVNPSLKTHMEAMARHITERYTNNQVVLVSRDRADENESLDFFKRAAAAYKAGKDTSSFREMIIFDNTAELSETNFAPYLATDRPTIFVVPSYKEESYVYSLLRKLKIDKTDFGEVIVYGMPRWKDFDQAIDFQLYEDLNVHISSSFFINDFSKEIKDFKKAFYDKFGILPREEAYIGYENMLYFGRLVSKYPDRFMMKIDQESYNNLYTTYIFRPVRNNGGATFGEQLNKVDRIENQYVHILEFEDFHFQKAD